MWKAKRKSRKRKNDRKIAEAKEFKEQREAYIKLSEQFKQEFIEFCEERQKQYESEYRKR